MEDSKESLMEFKKLIYSCFEKFRKREAIEDNLNRADCTFHAHIEYEGNFSATSNSENQKGLHNEKDTHIKMKQTKNYPECCGNVGERKSGSSGSDVIDAYRCLLIGLHCCGDLTPAMLKFYSQVDIVRGLCCVSCCYHRMTKLGNYRYSFISDHYNNKLNPMTEIKHLFM